MSIKRSKSQFEDKKWLNDIEKLNFNQKSKLINFSIFSITFDIVSIDFELFDEIRIQFNRFGRDDSISFREFGSKILTEWRLKSDSRRNIILSQFNRLSLLTSNFNGMLPYRVM